MASEPSSAPVASLTSTTTRRWPRYKISVPVRAIVRIYDKLMMIDGRGNDLNEGGMAVFAGVELKVGETVDIEFTPPLQSVSTRLHSIVRNRRGYYYGIEFLCTTPGDEQKISLIRRSLQAASSNGKQKSGR